MRRRSVREASAIGKAAARSSLRLAEVGWFAPLVIAQRIALMQSPQSAFQQREFLRMTAEKPLAWMQTAASIWLAMAAAQQQAWLGAWQAGRAWPSLHDGRLRAGTVSQLGKALLPVSRRVRANAKRLARRR